jgi:biopolymer transport protein ExbD
MPAPVAASSPTAAPAPPSPASSAPFRAVVRVDGKINFQGATYELPGFKSKLEAVMQAMPNQSIVLRAGKNVPYEDFRAALDICHSAGVKNLTVATPAPTPGSAAEPASNLPTPGLLMHSPDDSMSSNAPPMSPSGLSAPAPSTSSTPASGSP